jgi:hypothetical protein
MICFLKYLLLCSLISLTAFAQEAHLNEWGKDFEKVAVGARDDIQYSLYRKIGEPGKVYLEFQNRKNKDVKVAFKLVNKGIDRGTPVALTGFIKANGFWPNGYDRAIACVHAEPVIEIQDVITGEVEEEQVVEMDDQGKQTFRYKYRFRSDADLARDAARDKARNK